MWVANASRLLSLDANTHIYLEKVSLRKKILLTALLVLDGMMD